jgi:hypothetical protein
MENNQNISFWKEKKVIIFSLMYKEYQYFRFEQFVLQIVHKNCPGLDLHTLYV